MYYSHKLYYLNSNTALSKLHLKRNQPIDIIKLLEQDNDLTILLREGASYGDKLDKIIEAIDDKNKRYVSANIPQTKLFDLLSHQRADFIISYPIILATPSLASLDIHGLSITGTKHYKLSRLMCADTPKMEQTLNIINRKITELHHNKELFNLHLKKLHQSDVTQFEIDYQREFK